MPHTKMDSSHLIENPLAVTRVVNHLVHEFRSIRKSLDVYAGEAYWPIFDDPECARAIEELSARNVRVRVVAGPVLSRGGGKKSPRIIEMTSSGAIELYCRSTRGNKSHFRISDDQSATIQKSHEPLTPLAQRGHLRTVSVGSNEFSEVRSEFDLWAVDRFRSNSPESDFLVLDSRQLQRAFHLARDEGRDYNQLTRVEIEELVQKT